jgi:PIN domain nuclease of toxin-antitoxin system
VKLLLDTHLLLWAAGEPERLSPTAHEAILNPENQLVFSVASLWEVAIKSALCRPDFTVDPRLLRRGLIDNGYQELPIAGEHTIGISVLPPIHKDPFDRMLIAQAIAEEIVLMTVDEKIAQYPAPIQLV